MRVTKTSQVHFFEIILELPLECMSAFSSCHSGEQCWTVSRAAELRRTSSSSHPDPAHHKLLHRLDGA